MYFLIITVLVPVKKIEAIYIFHPPVVKINYPWFRTIIYIKMYDFTFTVLKFKRKFQNISYRSPSKAVHSLIVITYNADIIPFSRNQKNELLLYEVCILILIDHNIMDLISYFIQYIFMFYQHIKRFSLH